MLDMLRSILIEVVNLIAQVYIYIINVVMALIQKFINF